MTAIYRCLILLMLLAVYGQLVTMNENLDRFAGALQLWRHK